MLQKVAIRNYRCLREVDVPLRPLTVLIGENDTGKTAFLRALQHLASQREFGHITVADHWRQNSSNQAAITGWSDNGDGFVSNNAFKLDGLASLTPSAYFCLPSAGVAMEGRGHDDQAGPPVITENGEGVPALLDYLLRRDRKRFFESVSVLHELAPGLEEVEIATPVAEQRRIDLVIEKGLRIEANRASAGVRLLLFFVALAYHPVPPKLILLEEPENGIHPKRLQAVVDLLRSITEGEHGQHAAQVVITTHSPYLLDFIDVSRDQVLVFRRLPDGSRNAEPADTERLKTFLDEFMLGEVWFNQGEEGLIAKRR